jgi:hypothetical protein
MNEMSALDELKAKNIEDTTNLEAIVAIGDYQL